MSDMNSNNPVPFKAETHQLLEILIHSLYTEREVFLRELISNASDALTRLNFETLTKREIQDPELELGIWITADPDAKTLTIRDTGLGMTAAELAENLGTIAHSGARAFLEAARSGEAKVEDIIGQFGVGFYSAFMVADWIRVTSRSFQPEAAPAVWFSTGADTFTVGPAEKNERGTEVILRVKDEYLEFCKEERIRQIIKRHSDFVPFPIYVGENKEQANRQTALWRQQPRQVQEKDYQDYYRQLTLEFEPPLSWLHLSVDAPVQVYALLYIPASAEPGIVSTRKTDGLRLYARKVLIQEYCKDLLPQYLRFMAGVVDSEDLPLNVSRESVQSNRTMGQLKKLLTSKVLDHFASLAKDHSDTYTKFWTVYGSFLKEGIATPKENSEPLLPLLRFHSLNHPQDWISFDQYLDNIPAEQNQIYYLLGDSEMAALHSPHLEAFRSRGLDVLILADPIDSFALLNVTQYRDHTLADAATADLPAAPEKTEKPAEAEKLMDEAQSESILQRFKTVLTDRISDARLSDRLVESPVRLVQPKEGPSAEIQRVYRILQKDLDTPKPVLEINPSHPIIQALARLGQDDVSASLMVEQIFANAQIMEGLPVEPSQMVDRIQQIILKALK
ncbi:molecular chaperone, HSP90 family [Longilinea arvoryzae]|uniref:Chaperone protein HtpG n=1 Tax=Longilinea arvoryzae TaxID=360412 RepID=A0A0S7BAV8_9CHLR|nr:molecular chaperone HtpG [Longilinea arvoryzae]GAP14847.1 molecular chaperone, HSP90 family [Longilinea arvoryzae]